MRSRPIYWGLGLCFIILLDYLSKQWALHQLTYLIPVKITSFLNLTLAYNKGAAFSLLSQGSGWQLYFFVAMAIAISVVLVRWLFTLSQPQSLTEIGLVMILAGAWGNVIDRLHYGYVIDFIELHYRQYSWPVFNFADTVICIGVAILLFTQWKQDAN